MLKPHNRFRGATIFRLTYASYVRSPIGNADRSQIAEASARHNAQDGVTGVLIECAGEFIQVLEGERRAVKRTFTRIAEDPRHANVSILSTETSPARMFPDWTMGCFRVAPEDFPEPIFIDDGTNSRRLSDAASVRVAEFLSDFYGRHRALGLIGHYVSIDAGATSIAS